MTTRRETRPQTAGASQVRSDFSTGQFERGASPFVTLWAAGPIYILGSHFGISDSRRWTERLRFGQFRDL